MCRALGYGVTDWNPGSHLAHGSLVLILDLLLQYTTRTKEAFWTCGLMEKDKGSYVLPGRGLYPKKQWKSLESFNPEGARITLGFGDELSV